MEDKNASGISAAFNEGTGQEAEPLSSDTGEYAHVRKRTGVRSRRTINQIHRKGSDRLDQEPERFQFSIIGSRTTQEL